MAVGSSAVRAGRAFVELFAEPNKLYRTLDEAKRRVLNFAKTLATIGAGAAGLGAAVLTPIAKFFADAVKEGNDIENLANKFNTTAEAISEVRGAFLQAGITGDQFESIITSLSEKISHAADRNDYLVESLMSIGTGKQLQGLGIDKQLDIILERLAAIPDAQDRIRAANELGLGSLLLYLQKGKKGFDELREAFKANGGIFAAQDAKDAQIIFREFNNTMIGLKYTLVAVGKALLPTGKDFKDVGKDIRDALGDARAWIADNKQIVVGIAAVAAGLIVGGTALVGFAAGLTIVGPLITGGIIAAKGLAAGLALILSPAGLFVVALAAIAAGLIYLFSQTDRGQGMFEEMKSAFSDFAGFLKGSWQGVSDALKANDWLLAWKIGVATADVAWTGFIYGLTAVWADFKAGFVDGWKDVAAGISLIFTDLGGFLVQSITGTLRRIIDAFNSVVPKSLEIGTRGIDSDEKIQKDRQDVRDKILADRKKEQIADNEFRKKQTDTAGRAFRDAIFQLEDLKKLAAEEAAEAAKGEGAFERLRQFTLKHGQEAGGGGGLPSFTQLFASAKGIFGGPAQQQLGYGDTIGQRQLDAANQTAANTGQALDVLGRIAAKPAAVWQQ